MLFDWSNSLIAENIISNYSINSSNTPYTDYLLMVCQNVEVYGNNIEVAVDETVDEKQNHMEFIYQNLLIAL